MGHAIRQLIAVQALAKSGHEIVLPRTRVGAVEDPSPLHSGGTSMGSCRPPDPPLYSGSPPSPAPAAGRWVGQGSQGRVGESPKIDRKNHRPDRIWSGSFWEYHCPFLTEIHRASSLRLVCGAEDRCKSSCAPAEVESKASWGRALPGNARTSTIAGRWRRS